MITRNPLADLVNGMLLFGLEAAIFGLCQLELE